MRGQRQSCLRVCLVCDIVATQRQSSGRKRLEAETAQGHEDKDREEGGGLRGVSRRGRARGSLVQRLGQARGVAQLARPVREAARVIPFPIPVDRRRRQRLITAGTLPVVEVIVPLHDGGSFQSVGLAKCHHNPSQGKTLAEHGVFWPLISA